MKNKGYASKIEKKMQENIMKMHDFQQIMH